MYGKWLFKEIKTEYGLCKVEIYRKNFTDTAIEIGALESNSLTLAMENLGNITDPIGKSVCSFSIIDTDQIDYDEFFTPDATAYMVVVSTKTEGGAYVTRWSGYITPDFFAENLSYRTPISISARDNIGYLNDVDFDLDASTITVRGLIEAAFNRIAEDYPMQIVFATQKQTAEGVLAIDATISTMLLREGSWYEAIETVLHDLGLQMRWVDNNTIAVLDLSQIPEYYATQAFNFVDASGYREILPAWRELAQEQDYGLRENFFEGQINNANLRFVKEETLNLPLSMGGVTGNPVMKYYAPSNWGVAGSTLTINTDNYKYIGSYGQEPSGQGGRIYFTGVQKDAANLPQNYMSYRQPVYVSQRGKMSIAFNAFNSLLATNKISAETLQVYNPADRFMDFATGDSLQLGLKINVFLHVGTKTFILGDTWEEITGAETNSLYFTLDKVGQLGANGTTTPTEQEITIDVNTIPYNGELELRIYGFCIHEKTNLQEDAGLATYDWLKMVSYIDDVRYSYERELATGQGARTEIAPLHNVKESKSYKFGQVPVYAGGINAYAGGLYNASKNMESMMLFQRNANATSYNLLELVGREVIHFNKKNYNKLSGTIRNLAKEPLMFNRLFVRNGKRYAPFAYSLNIISNQMEITTMQEVENYVTESFSEINSAVTTGGAIVSAGNNTVMQYSQDAGNTKRIYELTAATEEEKKDTWVMIDGTAFPEARKINVKDLEGLNEEQVEAYLTEKKYATQSWVKGITDDLETDIANRVLIENFEKLEDAVDGIAGYFTNGSANNALKLGGQLPSYYATVDALNLVKNDITAVSNRVQKFEDVIGIDSNGDVYIKGMRNFYTERGTIGMAGLGSGGGTGGGGTAGLGSVTVRVNGQDYITDASGIVTLPNYPSLAGYATEQWVGANYLPKSGGELNYAYGPTPLRLVGSSPSETAIGFKRNGENDYAYLVYRGGENWAVSDLGWSKNLYLLHSGNYTDYALSKNGGTISYSGSWGLKLSSTSGADNYIWLEGIVNGSTNLLGGYGINGYNNPVYVSPTGYTYPIYHAGNFNPANYLPLSGGTISSGYANSLILKITNGKAVYLTFSQGGEDKAYVGYNADLGTFLQGPSGSLILTSSGATLYNNTLLHTGNYSSYALPLSGGTITHQNYGEFELKRNYVNYDSVIKYSNVDDGLLGYIGIGGSATANAPKAPYYSPNGDTVYALLHAGNYSSYALPLSGGWMSSGSGIMWETNTILWDSAPQGISLISSAGNSDGYWTGLSAKGYYGLQIRAYGGDTDQIEVRGHNAANYGIWRQVIHSGNIGSQSVNYANSAGNADTLDGYHAVTSGPLGYTIPVIGGDGVMEIGAYLDMHHDNSTANCDFSVRLSCPAVSGVNVILPSASGTLALLTSNVASATKLQTARIIWGQSFDGTGNVSGHLTGAGSIRWNGNYGVWSGDSWTGALTSEDTAIISNKVYFNGNVLIGTTIDSGAKLQIVGATKKGAMSSQIKSSAIVEIGAIESGNDALYIGQLDNSSIWMQSAYGGSSSIPSSAYTYNFLLQPLGGNVLIGTTEDNGAKLQVEGDATAKVLVANKNGDGGGGAGLSLYYAKDFVNVYGIHMSQTSAFGTGGDVTGVWATYFSMTDVGNGGWIFRGLYGNVVAISNTSGNITASGSGAFGGDMWLGGNLTVTGNITSEGTMAMARLASSSDAKLKENIKWLSADRAMGVVRALRPTEWDWKKDHTHSFGFIAQEVEPIVPEMVSSVNDTLRLEYNQLHAFEIGAIKHIDSEVEILKRDLKNANNRIESLENELKQYRRNA